MTRWGPTAAALALSIGILVAPPASAASRPNTTIKSGPQGLVASTTAKFAFKSSKPRSTFKCRLDSATWHTCTSPTSYKGLGQGAHTFAVRAKKGTMSDKSPATREFQVDSLPPSVTIAGPSGITPDHSPTFTFTSSEPATFTCRFGTLGAVPCSSPFTPPDQPDGTYAFEVSARDVAGNAAPATRSLEIRTPIALTPEFAAAAAALLLPDSATVDVPPNCGSSPAIDCPAGVPKPASDQLHESSTRAVVEVPGQSRYDLTAFSAVTTLDPVVISGFSVDCSLSATSANGANATWKLQAPLSFVVHAPTGELRIQVGDPSLTQVDPADLSITGASPLCASFDWGLAFLQGTFLAALTQQLHVSLCAAPGPPLVEVCPTS